MAKVTAPLLSLGATGAIAGTIVYSTWKGINTARQLVKPSNPQTAAQTTQRNLFSDMVEAWRSYFTDPGQRTAWNLAAQVGSTVQSGFNAAMSAMVKVAASDADASFASAGAAGAGQNIQHAMLNVDDGGQGDEAGDFENWVGDQPDGLLLVSSAAIAAGIINSGIIGQAGDVKYIQLRKGGYARSGISKITLN